MDTAISATTEEKYATLLARLAAWPHLALAYSGGVDSTFLLAAARAAGCDVLALTACTEALPRRELQLAEAYTRACGILHTVLEIDAFAVPQFGQNMPDRCYHCKKALFLAMLAKARLAGYPVLAEGSNADDTLDYRPGLAAVAELHVASPLKDAGLCKAEIRALSHRLGLPTWDKPSYACLASRVPYGEAITPGLLTRIDAAEQVLHHCGFPQGRVRCHGSVARIEVPAAQLQAALQARAALVSGAKGAGFTYVSLDLEGYRMGSLNEVLPPEML